MFSLVRRCMCIRQSLCEENSGTMAENKYLGGFWGQNQHTTQTKAIKMDDTDEVHDSNIEKATIYIARAVFLPNW